MQRVATGSQISAQPTPNADVGTPGHFANQAPGIGVPVTIPGPDWFEDKQEELCGVVSGLGITLDSTKQTLLLQALKRLAAGNITSITASATLTADNAGLVLVDASAGAVAITLPLANSAGGAPLTCRFVRTDTSANTVTVSMQGADTDLLTGAAASFQVAARKRLTLWGDGIGHWISEISGSRQVFLASGIFVAPAGVFEVDYVCTAAGGGGGGCTTSAAGGSGGAGGTAIGTCDVTPGASYTMTVGTGGPGGPAGTLTGSNGGASSFDAFATATGGSGAAGSGSNGSGGSATGGDINLAGGDGTDALATSNSATGGASYWGGGSSGSSGVASSPARCYGAGGGGAYGSTAAAGNDGAQGIIVVRWRRP